MPSKMFPFSIAAFLAVVLDQASKSWVSSSIPLGGEIPVIGEFFSITHVLNTGIVLGLFRGGAVWIFLSLTLVALGLIGTFYHQLEPRDRLSSTALGLVAGGAVGNGIDRLLNQAVTDFLHFDFGFFSYPDFNVADSAIVVGVAILVLVPETWRPREEDPAERPAENSA